MASKIEDKSFYVGVTPYEHEGQTYDVLNVTAGYRKGRGFYVNMHPGWKTDWGGFGCTYDFSGNPLSDTIWVDVKEATKNSQKTIDEMAGALELAKNDIAYLFDQRNWTELKRLMKDVALCGYTYTIEERMKELRRYPNGSTTSESETTNSNNSKSETTMAKEVKGADLIGKVLVLSDGKSKYVIKSVDGDKLAAEFSRGEGAAANVSLTVAQVESMISAGKAAWSDDVVQGSKVQGSSETVEEVEEVSAITPTKPVVQTVDMKPKEEKRPTGRDKLVVARVPHPGESGDGPKPTTPTKPTKGEGKKRVYAVVMMPANDGGEWPKLYGFKSDREAKAMAEKMAGSIRASWDYGKDGEGRATKTQHWYLKAGKRYVGVMKELADALNQGDRVAVARIAAKSHEVYAAVVADGKPAKKQKQEPQAVAIEPAPAPAEPAATVQGYTDKDVADMLKRIMAGGAIPDGIKAAMAA